MDENGIDTFLVALMEGPRESSRVMGKTSGRRFHRESFVAAQVGKRIISPMTYAYTCITLLFET